ncbi:hypothetical protein MHBO_000336 [Bonamia ostreae]|uniref:Uncharacterized protein n=1 Tax=Bonamia ostreae TaxID=126728 RepID=A0ABV2AFZ0_9EUKA
MENLGMYQILENEAKLNVERALWICEMATNGKNLYENENSQFVFQKISNFKQFYEAFLTGKGCADEDVEKILGEIKNIDVPIIFLENDSNNESAEYTLSAPSDWSQAVEQAHANKLFSQYSLKVDPDHHSVSIMGILTTLGVFSSAFIIQQATFGIFMSLGETSLQKWRKVQAFGMVIVYILCMTLALSGYIGQRDQVGQSVFEKMKMRYFTESGEVDYGFIVNESH